MRRLWKLTVSVLTGLAALTLASQQANAAVVFADDFETVRHHSVLNIQQLPNWNVQHGSVDLVKSGDFMVACSGGSGYCVDLDGSTKVGGAIQTKDVFGPGTYSLSFDFSGNQRGALEGNAAAGDAMIVSLGDWSHKIRALPDTSWKTFTITMEIQTAGQLSFSQLGLSFDYYGILIDNIALSYLAGDLNWCGQESAGACKKTATLPEPSALAVMILGLCLFCAMSRQGPAPARLARPRLPNVDDDR